VGTEGSGDLSVLVKPRLLSENDLPWLISLCKKKYDVGYDAYATEGWFRNIVLKTPLMFCPMRLKNSFAISMLTSLPWTPARFECHLVLLCADDDNVWETAKLLRASIEWARGRGCKRWNMTSDTDYNLYPLALRVGAKQLTPRHYIDL
jgi:hypothetical protein